MARMEKTLEMRGTKREEFLSYFETIGRKSEEGIYEGDAWRVEVHEQAQVRLGRVFIPSIRITFWVEERDFDSVIAKFRLAFLRGGA